MNAEKNTVLEVNGMTCTSCIRHVRDALATIEGVEDVDVALAEGIVVVHHDEQAGDSARMVEALREAGYESRPRQAGRA